MRIFPFSKDSRPVLAASTLAMLLQFLTGCGGESAAGDTGDPDAQLILLEPKGGETFGVGDSLRVRWKAQGKGLDEINSVSLSLSPDSGHTWIYLLNGSIAPTDAAWGAYRWKIPATLTAKGAAFTLAGNAQILVRVQDYQNVSDPLKTALLPKPISVRP